MPTNHDRFVDVFGSRAGQEFSAAEITELMLEESDIARGSILPNDHASGNASPCSCAANKNNQPIFDRVSRARYLVRQ
jgi:hypothetical protein